MDSLESQHGFEATFVSEVPEYLKCIICQLVLRKPIQIIKCGHKFCEPCFNRIKSYSQHSNTALVCPIDRHTIDLEKVFEDNGMERVIGSLVVKCGNNATGCSWTGDLRYLKVHEEQCDYQVIHHGQPTGQGGGVSSVLLKELCERMVKCEEGLMEKEKDIAFLKFNLQEVKNENKRMEVQLKEVKNKNVELKHVEVKLENISLKNIILEQKVDLLENQILLSKKQMEDNQVEVTTVKVDVENVKSMVENQQVSISAVRDEFKVVESSLYEKSSSTLNELKELQSNINDQVEKLKDSLKKQSDEIEKLNLQTTKMEKEVESKYNDLKDEISEHISEDSEDKLEMLKSHVRNIENILFCDLSGGCKEVVLQWKMQNYKYNFTLGEAVLSPTFYTEIQGYRFQFKVDWRGANKENIFLGLVLYRGSKNNEILQPFNTPYVLEAQDENGDMLSKEVTLAHIERNRKEGYTIPPGAKCTEGWGYLKFLTMPTLDNYIINDMLYVRCRLTPQ